MFSTHSLSSTPLLVISHLYNALYLQILVLPSLQPLHLLDVGVVRLAAATAAATAGAAAAFPLTVFPLDASLLLEFVVKGALALALETERCLNNFVKHPIHTFRQTECMCDMFLIDIYIVNILQMAKNFTDLKNLLNTFIFDIKSKPKYFKYQHLLFCNTHHQR